MLCYLTDTLNEKVNHKSNRQKQTGFLQEMFTVFRKFHRENLNIAAFDWLKVVMRDFLTRNP